MRFVAFVAVFFIAGFVAVMFLSGGHHNDLPSTHLKTAGLQLSPALAAEHRSAALSAGFSRSPSQLTERLAQAQAAPLSFVQSKRQQSTSGVVPAFPAQQNGSPGSVLEIKPFKIPGIANQNIPGEFEGCWRGVIHTPDSCEPSPCSLGVWVPEQYEFCFRRQVGDVLEVMQARGSFCGRGKLEVNQAVSMTVRFSSMDNGGPGCPLSRQYWCTLDSEKKRLTVREVGHSQSPFFAGGGTEYTWHATFYRALR